MPRSLWIKFLVLLVAVSAVALSAALVLREFMIGDFRQFLEGEREDRVYWVTAHIEQTYDRHGGWDRDSLTEDTLWALMLGFETQVFGMDDKVVMDTSTALSSLSPLVRNRVLAVSESPPREGAGSFIPYPLFLAGNEIGRLEVRFLKPHNESIFIERSNTFLVYSLLALGGLALVLSIVIAKRLTNPIKRLTSAAAAISGGDLKARVPVVGIDELGRLGESFNAMAHALETQESLRKKLLSNVAHELRTPLGAMRGELEGMIDGLIPTGREQLQSLQDETARLRTMLDGMEELARAQASVLTLRKQTVLLKPFLEHIISRTGKVAGDNHVQVNLECSETLTVSADPDRLSQIVINLLDNAVKAVKNEGIVTVRALEREREIILEVRDTGVGMKPEDLPFVFERFYRASEGGLGIGLAIVKELAEAHGGRIAAASEYGKGSVFTLVLPAP